MNSHLSAQNSPLEILRVNSKKVSCDGGSGSSNHPLVYLNMGKNDYVICPYCSKSFTTKKSLDAKSVKQILKKNS